MANYSKHPHFSRKQYDQNVTRIWQQLQTEEDSCDITLICDYKKLSAHKITLSSYSPIFKNLLKNSTNQHQVIFLRGIEYNSLQTMLDYIYQGQVNIAESDLEPFLKVAEDFKLRGLSDENGINFDLIPESFATINQKENKNILNPKCLKKNSIKENNPLKIEPINTHIVAKLTNVFTEEELKANSVGPNLKNVKLLSENPFNTLSRNDKFTFASSIKEINTNDESELNKIELKIPFYCDLCDYKSNKKRFLKEHKRYIHEGICYSCDKCEKQLKNSTALRRHIERVHDEDEVCYPCDQCIFKSKSEKRLQIHVKTHIKKSAFCDKCSKQFSNLIHLRRHILSVHEGIRYPCDKCGHKFTDNGNLNKHLKYVHQSNPSFCAKCGKEYKDKRTLQKHEKSVHEGIRHTCPQCSKQYNASKHLRMHIRTAHEGVRYPCDQCNYQATQKIVLKTHKMRIHNKKIGNP